MMFYFVTRAFVVINLVFSVKGERLTKANSSKKCSVDIISNDDGEFPVAYEQNCPVFYIDIECQKKDSILNLTIQYVWEDESSATNEFASSFDERNVDVGVYELSKTFPKEQVLFENWTLEKAASVTNLSYLTLTSTARVRISGNWSECNVTFLYNEYKYEVFEHESDSLEVKGKIETGSGEYRPNCVNIYRVTEARNMNVSSIEMTLHFLDIDAMMGEYIMIGEGKDVFKGSPSLFITQAEPDTVYYVNGVSAYVVFASNSRRTQRRGFSISWRHTGTKLVNVDEPLENILEILYSVPICFYNSSNEPLKYENMNKEVITEFRERIVETAQNYASKKLKEINYKSLSASSVVMYEPSKERIRGMGLNPRNPTFYVLIVKDLSSKKPLFKWKQLEEIVELFEDTTKDSLIYGYKVGKCPRGFTYTKMGSLLIYTSVPVFGFLFLMIWAWKQKIFEQACKNSMFPNEAQKDADTLSKTKIALQNEYEWKIPKVVVENDRGRRQTLDHRNSYQINVDERDIDEANISDLTAAPLTDSDSTNIKQLISSTRSRRRPSVQSLLYSNDHADQSFYGEKMQENEDEHVYDSVSRDTERETRL